MTTSPWLADRTQAPGSPAADLIRRFGDVRAFTEKLCEPLAIEDYVIQTMLDVSPTKWHLAHTTWFFERFILEEHQPGYEPIDRQYYYLFNSYYNTVGPQHCRPNRGLLSRPTVAQVYDYRHAINQRLSDWLATLPEATLDRVSPLLAIGINHEQQHQELIVTDLKHVFSTNPLLPAYHHDRPVAAGGVLPPMRWVWFDGGVVKIGRDEATPRDFCYDNETPRHRVFIEPFELASRLVTNDEYLQFIEDGGYDRPELWLSMGWATVQAQKWSQPIYWYRHDEGGAWWQFTLDGPQPLVADEPVCHVSYYEADAFARWSGARLATEFEWEHAAGDAVGQGGFSDTLRLHPRPLAAPDGADAAGAGVDQLFGELWQWTSSSYGPYPGYTPPPGALGEYNGKFMCNQYVLRGGSCATPRSHLRTTYRNFFPPEARWQFSGIRLARGL